MERSRDRVIPDDIGQMAQFFRSTLKRRLNPYPTNVVFHGEHFLKRSKGLDHLEEDQKHVYNVLKESVVGGISDSVLIFGPHGSGKSQLLSNVFNKLNEELVLKKSCVMVRLNGLLQTDEKSALREITRQLNLEAKSEGRTFGTFSENLSFLLEALYSGNAERQTVVLILDEFDLFCGHKRQSLLYNLFDVAQSAKTPICVVGLCVRLDTLELLEKRVKSRFSHRQIFLFQSPSWKEYRDYVVSLLTLDKTSDVVSKETLDEWNEKICALVDHPFVSECLTRLYEFSPDTRALRIFLFPAICQIQRNHLYLDVCDIGLANKIYFSDPIEVALKGLSVLEVCLLISLKHIVEFTDGQPVNFETIYEEYKRFSQRRSSMRVYDRSVAEKAFERLRHLELIRCTETVSRRKKHPPEYVLHEALLLNCQLIEAFKDFSLPTEIQNWLQDDLSHRA